MSATKRQPSLLHPDSEKASVMEEIREALAKARNFDASGKKHVLAVLPKLDCVVLVTAVGTTTPAEIKESAKHLPSTEAVRLVANKVRPSKSKYYY